jgi:hypothetical protein
MSVGAECSVYHHATEIKKAKNVPYSVLQWEAQFFNAFLLKSLSIH